VHQPPDEDRAPIDATRHGMRLAGVLVGCALLYGFGLGLTDLWAPDEPRYAAIAEQLRDGRYGLRGVFLLHLNDQVYTQKPPLFFWVAALLGAPGERVTEVAARLPSALAGLASVALTAAIGRQLRLPGGLSLLGAAMLATSFRFAHTARRAQLDGLLVAFELVAIALYLSLEARGGAERARERTMAVAGLHAALGAAALTKGPVGWLPLLVIAVHLLAERRGAALRAIVPAWGLGLSLGPLLLWAATSIALAPPGYVDSAIGENLLGRFFSGTAHVRPFYYYAYQLPLDFLPWSLVLPFGVAALAKSARRRTADEADDEGLPERRAARFLIAWVVVPFVFFTLSAGKRGLYLLPIFPALALAAALAGRSVRDAPGWRGGLASASGWRAVLAVAVCEALLFWVAFPLIDHEKSPRPIAAAAARLRGDGPVGVYALAPLEGGLAYYGAGPIARLDRPEQIAGFLETGGELVVLRHRHLGSLAKDLGLVEVESFRSGTRRIVLACRARPKSATKRTFPREADPTPPIAAALDPLHPRL
jgi:4-amino-4-deoxy-L-arabinose transferase-like glycosyltransferase